MTDHAPLPWKVLFENGIEAENDTSVVVYAEKEDKNDLCGVRGVTDEEAEANAAFIVEACNNYEKLRELVQFAVDNDRNFTERDPAHMKRIWIERARHILKG